MLTTAEAAAQLGKTRRQVLKLISQGRLTATRFGSAWQVDPASVEQYKASPHKPGWPEGRKRSTQARAAAHAAQPSQRKDAPMEKIVLEQFGPVTRFDAAHIIDDSGRIGAYIAEPEARNGEGGTQAKDWDEQAFRSAVEAEVSTWVQYDPGRDRANEVKVMLQG
jgi:excisionase family DNA binding protein